TPLIAHWPAGIPAASAGQLRHTPAHVIDIVPTALELTGTTKPAIIKDRPVPPAPGKSLVPAFAKDQPIARDSLWWLHEDNRAIRIGDWKLISAKGDPWALYDLTNDRAEQHDLSQEHPDKAKELEARWIAEMESMRSVLQSEPGPTEPSPKKTNKSKKAAERIQN
ncbi:MAG TPA: sulfatase/phosphatase domain-containing protein, partial [Prosthecobacter sp.]|nr:sulfatase/phosphatase domain-containing protein [Prosthecobacter sp.]